MNLAREPLPKTTAIQLFKSLLLARRSEEYIVKHYPENLMRTPMHMSMGQEFVPVGVCAALEGKADVFASYRSHAAFLAQTHDTDRFFSKIADGYRRLMGATGGDRYRPVQAMREWLNGRADAAGDMPKTDAASAPGEGPRFGRRVPSRA